MAAHRYWKLRVTDNPDNYKILQASELEFRESLGGAAVVPTSSTASSTFSGSYPVSSLFDGSVETAFVSLNSAGFPVEIVADFGSTPRDIKQVTLRSRQGSQAPAGVPEYLPRDFTVQWSDDNIAWTIALTVTGMTSGDYHPLNKRPFAIDPTPTNGKLSCKWRFYGSAEQDPLSGSGNQGGIAVGDMKLFEGATLAPRSTTGTRCPTAYFSSPYLALDPSLSWGTSHVLLPGILEMEFEQAITPTVFSMKSSNTAGLSPKDWKLQYWGGSAWLDYITKTGEPTWATFETRSYSPQGPVRRRPLIIPN